jgi:hypothetical protein
MDGWMGGWVDGWVDGQTGGWINVEEIFKIFNNDYDIYRN